MKASAPDLIEQIEKLCFPFFPDIVAQHTRMQMCNACQTHAGAVEIFVVFFVCHLATRPDDLTGPGQLELELQRLRPPIARCDELVHVKTALADVCADASMQPVADVLVEEHFQGNPVTKSAFSHVGDRTTHSYL